MRRRSRRRIVLQVGDVWEYQTNRGILLREITRIDGDDVSYRRADAVLCQCSRASFVKWTWGAMVVKSDHWHAHGVS